MIVVALLVVCRGLGPSVVPILQAGREGTPACHPGLVQGAGPWKRAENGQALRLFRGQSPPSPPPSPDFLKDAVSANHFRPEELQRRLFQACGKREVAPSPGFEGSIPASRIQFG